MMRAATLGSALLVACAFPEANKIDAAPGGGGSAGAGGVATGGDGGGGMPPGPCDAEQLPEMVQVVGPAGNYCIDRTEVTRAQWVVFQAFTATNVPEQPPGCEWNTSFVPVPPSWQFTDAHPIGGIDWCDAAAYCLWAGKRMCGKIGGLPGDYTPGMVPVVEDMWHTACSLGAQQRYPYGQSYDPSACNGIDFGLGQPAPAGSIPTCEGAYPGIFDLWGNMVEWQSGCEGPTGPMDNCLVRGGSFVDGDVGCGGYFTAPRNTTSGDNIGFRCCRD
jgi:formylglycine-generating enzyme required for sulfatase activity